MGCRQTIPVIRPALWQIERPINDGMTTPEDIGCEHTDLAIGNLASRTGILPTDTAGRLALLEKAGLIKHENGIGIG